jgi:TetR/AcrR family transcriptional repressor of nem operon
MRKAQKHSTTKETFLNVANDLMLTQGYEATALDEICEKAGLTKGSFFHYFKSKEDLAKALLTRKCSNLQKTKEELYGPDPLKRVYGQINMAIEMSKNPKIAKGCLKGMLAQEMSDTHPEIRRICQEYFNNMAEGFAVDLRAAKAKYAPKALFDPLSVAKHFVAILQGSLILVKTYQDHRLAIESIKHFKKYVESLFRK